MVSLLLPSLTSALAVALVSPHRDANTGTVPLQILATPPDKLRAHFGWDEHPKRDKAELIWSALRHGIDVLDAEECSLTKHLSPNINHQLVSSGCKKLSPLDHVKSSLSKDGTEKLLVALADGLAVECVIIPMFGGKHSSLCVSSQVGCSRGCAFCSTGAMGFVRSLTAEEILGQVWMALRVVRKRGMPKLINIVFMGMYAQNHLLTAALHTSRN